MTDKTAAAGLPFGGGKAVVALPTGTRLGTSERRAALLDVGDVVDALGGAYLTGPDVGTGPADMAVIAERTDQVLCTPAGSGDSAPATATATVACLRATCQHLYGDDDLAARSFVLVGLGHVGLRVAEVLARAGARLTVSDLDHGKRPLADRLAARWVDPDQAARTPADILIPAALGGGLTPDTVRELRCAAVVGPANNQLADDEIAAAMHARTVLWAPDYLVSAGGIVHATAVEIDHASPHEAHRRVEAIAQTLSTILADAAATGISPHQATRRLIHTRLRIPAR